MFNGKTHTAFTIALLASLLLMLAQCRKDVITTDSNAKIALSTDSVLFDTLFSTIGSTTEVVKVYNNNSQTVRISRIWLDKGAASNYRINVDGNDGFDHRDIELEAGDSIYIFVEVTIDPGNVNIPFIVEDLLRLETNGNQQQVVLNAWGQDAYFHGGLGALTVLDCNAVWNNDKPHVLYGIVAVDSACTLTINEGTKVYCHYGSGLYVYKGTLNIIGSKNNEVVFQNDRLDAGYEDLPGQWGINLSYQTENSIGDDIGTVSRGGIWIYESPGSSIDYAILKNGTMGLQVDTTGTSYEGSTPSVLVKNTKILNMSGIGLWGQGAYLKGSNLLVGNCGESCAYLGIGGRYEMDNCTFADYWTSGNRTAPAFVLNNYYEDIYQVINIRPLISCEFRNCIMFGSNAFLNDYNEFFVDILDGNAQEYVFRYCLVDTDQNVSDDGQHWFSMVNGQGPYLCGPADGNFKISSADSRMAGFPFNFDSDINGLSNGDWKGCYDFDNSPDGPCVVN